MSQEHAIVNDARTRENLSFDVFQTLLRHPELQTPEFETLLIQWCEAVDDFEREYQKHNNYLKDVKAKIREENSALTEGHVTIKKLSGDDIPWGRLIKGYVVGTVKHIFSPKEDERFFYPSGYDQLAQDARRQMQAYCSRPDVFEAFLKFKQLTPLDEAPVESEAEKKSWQWSEIYHSLPSFKTIAKATAWSLVVTQLPMQAKSQLLSREKSTSREVNDSAAPRAPIMYALHANQESGAALDDEHEDAGILVKVDKQPSPDERHVKTSLPKYPVGSPEQKIQTELSAYLTWLAGFSVQKEIDSQLSNAVHALQNDLGNLRYIFVLIELLSKKVSESAIVRTPKGSFVSKNAFSKSALLSNRLTEHLELAWRKLHQIDSTIVADVNLQDFATSVRDNLNELYKLPEVTADVRAAQKEANKKLNAQAEKTKPLIRHPLEIDLNDAIDFCASASIRDIRTTMILERGAEHCMSWGLHVDSSGLVVTRNYMADGKDASYLIIPASRGNAIASQYLGMIYLNEAQVEKNPEKREEKFIRSLLLFQQACDLLPTYDNHLNLFILSQHPLYQTSQWAKKIKASFMMMHGYRSRDRMSAEALNDRNAVQGREFAKQLFDGNYRDQHIKRSEGFAFTSQQSSVRLTEADKNNSEQLRSLAATGNAQASKLLAERATSYEEKIAFALQAMKQEPENPVHASMALDYLCRRIGELAAPFIQAKDFSSLDYKVRKPEIDKLVGVLRKINHYSKNNSLLEPSTQAVSMFLANIEKLPALTSTKKPDGATYQKLQYEGPEVPPKKPVAKKIETVAPVAMSGLQEIPAPISDADQKRYVEEGSTLAKSKVEPKKPEPKKPVSRVPKKVVTELKKLYQELVASYKGSKHAFVENIVSGPEPDMLPEVQEMYLFFQRDGKAGLMNLPEHKLSLWINRLEKLAPHNALASHLLAMVLQVTEKNPDRAIIFYAQNFLQWPEQLGHDISGKEFPFFMMLVTHIQELCLSMRHLEDTFDWIPYLDAVEEAHRLKQFAVIFQKHIQDNIKEGEIDAAVFSRAENAFELVAKRSTAEVRRRELKALGFQIPVTKDSIRPTRTSQEKTVQDLYRLAANGDPMSSFSLYELYNNPQIKQHNKKLAERYLEQALAQANAKEKALINKEFGRRPVIDVEYNSELGEKLNKQAEAQTRKSSQEKKLSTQTETPLKKAFIDFRKAYLKFYKEILPGVITSEFVSPESVDTSTVASVAVLLEKYQGNIQEGMRQQPHLIKALQEEAPRSSGASSTLALVYTLAGEHIDVAIMLYAQAYIKQPSWFEGGVLSGILGAVLLRIKQVLLPLNKVTQEADYLQSKNILALEEAHVLNSFAKQLYQELKKDHDSQADVTVTLSQAEEIFAAMNVWPTVEAVRAKVEKKKQEDTQQQKEIVASWEGIDDIEAVGEGNKIYLRRPSPVAEKSKTPGVPVTTDEALQDELFELVTFYKTQPISHKGFVSRKEGLLQEGNILPDVMTMGMEVAANYGPSGKEAAVGYNAYLKKHPQIQDKLFAEATKGNAYTSYLLASIYPQHQPEALVFAAQCVRKPDKKDKAPYAGIKLFLKIAQQRIDTLKGNSAAREEIAHIEKAVKAVQEYHEHEKNPKKSEKQLASKAPATEKFFSPAEARKEFDALLAEVSQRYSPAELQRMGITSALSHEGRRYLEEDDFRIREQTKETLDTQNQRFARYALTDPKYALRMSTVYFIGDGVKADAVLGRLLRLQAILLVHHENPEEVELFYKMVSLHRAQADNMFQRNLRVVQEVLTPEVRQQFDSFLDAAQREPYNPYTLAGFMQLTFDELSRLMSLFPSFIFRVNYKKFVVLKPAIDVLMAMNQFMLTRIQDMHMDPQDPRSSQITQFCNIVSKTQAEFQKRVDYLVSTSPKKGHENDYDWTPNIIGVVLGLTMAIAILVHGYFRHRANAPRIAPRREAEREPPRPRPVERVVDPVVEAQKRARKSHEKKRNEFEALRDRVLKVKQKIEALSKKSDAEQTQYEKTFIEKCESVFVVCDQILEKVYPLEKAEELINDLGTLKGYCATLEEFSLEYDKAKELDARYKNAFSNLQKVKSHIDELKSVPIYVEVKKEDLIKQKKELESQKTEAESKKEWLTKKTKEREIKEVDGKIETLSKALGEHKRFESRCQETTEAAYPIGRIDELEKVISDLNKTCAELRVIVHENQVLVKQHESSMKKHETQERIAHDNLVAECNALQATLRTEAEQLRIAIERQCAEIDNKFSGVEECLGMCQQLRAWSDQIGGECEELLLLATYVCEDMPHAELLAHHENLVAKRSILDLKHALRYEFEGLYVELSRREIKQAKKDLDEGDDQDESNTVTVATAKPAQLVRLASKRDVNSDFVHIPTLAEVARAEKEKAKAEYLKAIGWMKNPLSLILRELERHANQQEKDYIQYPLIGFYSLFYALHELQFFIATAHKLRGRIQGLEIPPLFCQDAVGFFAKDFSNKLMHTFAQLDYDSMLTCVRAVYCESVIKKKLLVYRGKLIHEGLQLDVAKTQLWSNLTKAGNDPDYFTPQGAVKRLHKTFLDLAEIIDKFVLKDPDKQQHQRRTPHYLSTCKALIMFFGQIDQDLLCNIKGAERLRNSALFKATLESFLARCRKTVRNLERHGTNDETEQDAFWGQRFLDLQQDNNMRTIVFDNTSPDEVETLIQEAQKIFKDNLTLFEELTKIANGEVEEKKEGKAKNFNKKAKTKFGLGAVVPPSSETASKKTDGAEKKSYFGKKK